MQRSTRRKLAIAGGALVGTGLAGAGVAALLGSRAVRGMTMRALRDAESPESRATLTNLLRGADAKSRGPFRRAYAQGYKARASVQAHKRARKVFGQLTGPFRRLRRRFRGR